MEEVIRLAHWVCLNVSVHAVKGDNADKRPLFCEEIATVNILTPTTCSYLWWNKVKRLTQRLRSNLARDGSLERLMCYI